MVVSEEFVDNYVLGWKQYLVHSQVINRIRHSEKLDRLRAAVSQKSQECHPVTQQRQPTRVQNQRYGCNAVPLTYDLLLEF